jgi:hypothetical protein
MITNEVINEIYKKFGHRNNSEDLRIGYYVELLSGNHTIIEADDEIVIEDLEECNPFRCFLKRSLNAILEFDKVVAFVFRNHILFIGKRDNQVRVHLKQDRPQSFWKKIFRHQ